MDIDVGTVRTERPQTAAEMMAKLLRSRPPGGTSADVTVALAELCNRCGEPLDFELGPVTAHGCCTCMDSGRVRRLLPLYDADGLPTPGFGRTVPCPGCSQARVDPFRAIERMRIPDLFADATVDSWVADSPAAEATLRGVHYWLSSWPPASPFILFEGDPGRGKTHLAIGCLKAALERHGAGGLFLEVPTWLDELRELANPELWTIDRDMELEQAPRNAGLLVLDDIAAERGTDWTRERLYLLVNHRYTAKLPTLFTTNSPIAKLDPRLRSRVQSGLVVRFSGPDRRLAG